MWVGKRVQRAARKAHLPQQVGLRRWEPNSYEGANATESVPKHTVEFGRCNLGARAKRGSPLGVLVVQTNGAAAPQVVNVADSSQRSTRRGEPRFAGRPRGQALSVRWRSVATKGKQKLADKASSLVNQAKSTTVDRPRVGLMVPIYVRRPQVCLWSKRRVILILGLISSITNGYQSQYHKKIISLRIIFPQHAANRLRPFDKYWGRTHR